MTEMATTPLGIIGAGQLASFLVEGIRHARDGREILLSPRNPQVAASLAERHGCQVASSNQAVVDGAKIVVLATPPGQVLATLRALVWQEQQLLICVAVDVELAALRSAAPAATVVRAMPTAASAVGMGSTPVFPAHPQAQALFSIVGDVWPCADEEHFKAATALSTYHLWLYGLMERMAEAAEESGLPRDAAVGLVASLTRSAGALALARDKQLSMRAPLDDNGTPGTMTRQGYDVIEAENALEPWARALARAVERARQPQAAPDR